mmetsp:Transcript_37456/g.79453  ORF Transcript_37456/g.79453 Transcript_37456/m.79453 type:complete len:239 (+) Transcript_37456:519-1235(+)
MSSAHSASAFRNSDPRISSTTSSSPQCAARCKGVCAFRSCTETATKRPWERRTFTASLFLQATAMCRAVCPDRSRLLMSINSSCVSSSSMTPSSLFLVARCNTEAPVGSLSLESSRPCFVRKGGKRRGWWIRDMVSPSSPASAMMSCRSGVLKGWKDSLVMILPRKRRSCSLTGMSNSARIRILMAPTVDCFVNFILVTALSPSNLVSVTLMSPALFLERGRGSVSMLAAAAMKTTVQ